MSEFVEVLRRRPCAICGKTRWCSYHVSGRVQSCRWVCRDGAEERLDKNGVPYYLYLDRAIADTETIRPVLNDDIDATTLEDRDRVYRALIAMLPLTRLHRQNLLARGLSDRATEANGYRSMPEGDTRYSAARALVSKFGADVCSRIPGVIHRESQSKKGTFYWKLAGRAGILIPVREPDGRISGIVIRTNDAVNADKKYVWLSSKYAGGPGAVSSCHVPIYDGPTDIVRVTEGQIKADISTLLSGTLTLGIPGCQQYMLAMPVLQRIQPKTLLLAWDSDSRTNQRVGDSLKGAIAEFQAAGFDVKTETWPDTYKGIDDLLQAGGVTTVADAPKHDKEKHSIYSDRPPLYTDPKPFTGFTGFKSRYAMRGTPRG